MKLTQTQLKKMIIQEMKSTLKEGKLDQRDAEDFMDSVDEASSSMDMALTILQDSGIKSGPLYDRIYNMNEELDKLAEEVRKKYRGRSSY
jgi:hypothetical protein